MASTFPRLLLDIAGEAERLKAIMDEQGNVNIFLSEGAGLPEIIAEMEANGEEVQRDPFGHVKLDTINPGQWFARKFAALIGAEKVMVQKSGYYSRAAAAHEEDLALIKQMCDLAVECALRGESGVIGQDEENGDSFPRLPSRVLPAVSLSTSRSRGSPICSPRFGQPVSAAQ